jgi:hypothetical protein
VIWTELHVQSFTYIFLSIVPSLRGFIYTRVLTCPALIFQWIGTVEHIPCYFVLLPGSALAGRENTCWATYQMASSQPRQRACCVIALCIKPLGFWAIRPSRHKHTIQFTVRLPEEKGNRRTHSLLENTYSTTLLSCPPWLRVHDYRCNRPSEPYAKSESGANLVLLHMMFIDSLDGCCLQDRNTWRAGQFSPYSSYAKKGAALDSQPGLISARPMDCTSHLVSMHKTGFPTVLLKEYAFRHDCFATAEDE